jgi:MFS family permease
MSERAATGREREIPLAPARGSLRRSQLRRAFLWSYVASAVWAAGNVFAGGVLINYLAQELGAKARDLAWLGAAQALVGVLRLLTPPLIVRFGNAKRLCLSMSLASYAVLAGIPLAVHADVSDRRELLEILIVVYCLHQLLEQIATVALFSWLGDLVPRDLLGRYFGVRNLIQLVVTIAALLASAAASTYLQTIYADKVVSFAVLAGVGTVCYFLAMAPLAAVPATRPRGDVRSTTFAELIAPLRQPSSRRLLTYNCWFSFFQGLLAAPQSIYTRSVLKLSFADVQQMQTSMRVGQAVLSPFIGWAGDRRGNVPILVASQLLVGAAPLAFLWANADYPNRLYAAYALWIFYAGINICLPNLTILLAPPGGQAPHLAAYYVSGSLFVSAGTLAGGYAFDALVDAGFQIHIGSLHLDPFAIAFLFAFATRTAGALLLLRINERSESA